MNNKFIYKIGNSYFSSMEKAIEYRRKYYRSYPWIETIELDKKYDDKLVVTGYWRTNESGTEIVHSDFYLRSLNKECEEYTAPDRVVKYQRNTQWASGVYYISCNIEVQKARDIYKIKKDQSIDQKVKEGFKKFLGLKVNSYSIKI